MFCMQALILARLLGQQISMDNINVCLFVFVLFLKIHSFNFDIDFYKHCAFGLWGVFSLLLIMLKLILV